VFLQMFTVLMGVIDFDSDVVFPAPCACLFARLDRLSFAKTVECVGSVSGGIDGMTSGNVENLGFDGLKRCDVLRVEIVNDGVHFHWQSCQEEASTLTYASQYI